MKAFKALGIYVIELLDLLLEFCLNLFKPFDDENEEETSLLVFGGA